MVIPNPFLLCDSLSRYRRAYPRKEALSPHRLDKISGFENTIGMNGRGERDFRLGKTFGDRIRLLRSRKGWTQEELAKKLLISDKAVSKWENDHGLPDVGYLVKIADVLEATLDYLLRGDPSLEEAESLFRPEVPAE